jgi:hypothetical protein
MQMVPDAGLEPEAPAQHPGMSVAVVRLAF